MRAWGHASPLAGPDAASHPGPRRIGLIGGGTVGSAVAQALAQRPDLTITGVLVRNAHRPRSFPDAERIVTTQPAFLAEADVVVEVAGGTGEAADLALAALARGQAVVSANKAALAERWSEFAPYLESGRLRFEAAVMAGVPVVGALSGGLRGAAPIELHAVLNGTCNVILAAMETGRDYSEALSEAQRLGFAEADPRLDVSGIDSAHKLVLLQRLAFDGDASWPDLLADTSGIDRLDPAAVRAAAADGRAVRLVGSIGWTPGSGWGAKVRAVSLPGSHPLVARGAVNALLLRGAMCQEVLMRGLGAGGAPTASAVVSDVLAAVAGRPGPAPLPAALGEPVTVWPAAPEAEFSELAP